ncbi:MAG: hypothetical protein RIM99_12860 [Cyclobacteriaceae bacterium]
MSTRARINQDFVSEKSYDTQTLAIIPVRGGSQDIAFKLLSETNLLELKLQKVLQSKNVEKVVVTSTDLEIQNLLRTFGFDDKVEFHHRKRSEARHNQNLNLTVEEIATQQAEAGVQFVIMAILTLEYPFLEPYKIDDVINTMLVFGSDSIIGVRSENSVFYQHHGDGLHPILDRDKYTKLEREALFKQVGGISAVDKDIFLAKNEVVTGNVGHVIIDQLSSMGLFTKMDWEIAELISQKSLNITDIEISKS